MQKSISRSYSNKCTKISNFNYFTFNRGARLITGEPEQPTQ